MSELPAQFGPYDVLAGFPVRSVVPRPARAQLAADLPQIYLNLLRQSGPAMATLEDHWNQVRVPHGKVGAALQRVRDAAARADDGRAALRLPRAWRVLGEALASPGTDGIARREALRTRAAELVSRVRGNSARSTLPGAKNYRELLAAGADLVGRRYAAAVSRLEPLADDPMLSGVVLPLLGLARLNAGRPADAACAWETDRVRGWPAVQHNAVLAHLAAAAVASGRSQDPLPHLERAKACADHVVRLAPDRAAWRRVRLQVWFVRAKQGALIDRLTEQDYHEVEADLGALEGDPSAAAQVAEWRVELNLLYLQLPGIAPASETELERRALAALAAWETRAPTAAIVAAERARQADPDNATVRDLLAQVRGFAGK